MYYCCWQPVANHIHNCGVCFSFRFTSYIRPEACQGLSFLSVVQPTQSLHALYSLITKCCLLVHPRQMKTDIHFELNHETERLSECCQVRCCVVAGNYAESSGRKGRWYGEQERHGKKRSQFMLSCCWSISRRTSRNTKFCSTYLNRNSNIPARKWEGRS